MACSVASRRGGMPSSSGVTGNTAPPSGTSSDWCDSPSDISASGDRGDDAQLVAVLDGGLHAVEVADVLVVEVDVDELADLVALVVEAGLDAGVLGDEGVEHFFDGGAGDFDGGLAL